MAWPEAVMNTGSLAPRLAAEDEEAPVEQEVRAHLPPASESILARLAPTGRLGSAVAEAEVAVVEGAGVSVARVVSVAQVDSVALEARGSSSLSID